MAATGVGRAWALIRPSGPALAGIEFSATSGSATKQLAPSGGGARPPLVNECATSRREWIFGVFTEAMSFAARSWAQEMVAHLWDGDPPDRNYLQLDPVSTTDTFGFLRPRNTTISCTLGG